MNVHDIKAKAKSVMALNRNNILTIFAFITIMTATLSSVSEFLDSNIPLLMLILSFALLPLKHGNVVTALKVVNEQSNELSFDQDGLAGVKRYKSLFFTYFIKELFLIIITTIGFLLLGLVAKLIIGDKAFVAIIKLLTTNNTNIYNYLTANEIAKLSNQLANLIIIGGIIICLAILMYSLYFSLTPYVLEKYHLTGAKAMSESARLMKGHKMTLLALYLSFIGWALLTLLLFMAVYLIVPIEAFGQILLALIATYIFLADFNVCMAVFFEEIDLEDKNIIE